MVYLIQNESFPWESSDRNKITFTKEKIIEKTISDRVLKYSIGKSNSPNEITYSFGEVSHVTIIDSKNIHFYLNKDLFNVYLYADDIENLFNNLFAIYNNVYGWISIKLNPVDTYNLEELSNQIDMIFEFYREAHQHICINEFENYKYDKDLIYIKSNFDCIVNPYYYKNKIISNILTGYSNNFNVEFNDDFYKKHELFNKFNCEDTISSIIARNAKEKNMKFYEKYILNGEKIWKDM